MSYNQPHNSRYSGNRQQDSRMRGSHSHEAANYDVPLYDPSTYDTRDMGQENRMYRQNENWQNEGRRDEGYRMDQDFRRNRDYRSIQQDYSNQQADYNLGDAEDWEQRPEEWDRPRQARGGYQSAQFAGRQSSVGQRPQNVGNAAPHYGSGRDSEFRRAQRWGGEQPYSSQFNQYEEQEGYYPPQGARWQSDASRGGYGGGYTQQDAGFQSWLDRGFRDEHQADHLGRSDQQSFRGRAPKGYERSDERIREDVCERLTNDHQIDASEITVTVKTGVVTLEGSISDRNQKYRAEDLADNVSGVKDVQNRLNVARTNQQSAQGSGTSSSGSDLGRSATGGSDLSRSTTPNVTRQ